MSATYKWIHRVWYEGAPSGFVLLPLAGVYWLLLKLRALLFRCGILSVEKAAVPVIVVGNLTAGGTGKTPTVVWLVNHLRKRGFRPGVVSRGYGGSKSGTSMRVDSDSDAAVVGDEPVLLARRGDCPVAVDADRLRAAAMLVDDDVDVIVADDGLQHLRLHRDYEICVIDGSRGFGNGRLLPAGPLREFSDRVNTVDCVLVNGGEFGDATRFDLLATEAHRHNGSLIRSLSEFRGTTVHAVAGIGNPPRFFDLLREHGIQVIEHSIQDHAALNSQSLRFGDEFDVFMTEKDAVKLTTRLPDKYWYVPVDLIMDAEIETKLIADIEARIETSGDPQ